MTSVLNELRSLDAARARGDISGEDFTRIRGSLLDAIEDATLVGDEPPDTPEPVVAAPAPISEDTKKLWHIIAFLCISFVLCTGFTAWLFGDLTLALTLSATLMAALTVRAFLKLEDDT